MAEQIDVPGIGRVKSEYVTAAVAAVGGFVVYAYWRRRQSANAALPIAVPVVDPSQIPATDYRPPATGDASGHQDLTTPSPPRTNPEWVRAATEYLGNIGFDPAMVARALGAYMTRQGLDPSQMDAVRSAVGAFGEPPTGGPWAIIPQISKPPGGGTPPPPSGGGTPPPPPPPPPPVESGFYFHPDKSPAPLSTLWGLAQSAYGDASQWPRIWNHPKNAGNRAYSQNNPNLIYTGQNWWIPT